MKKVVFTSVLIATLLAGGVLVYKIWTTPVTGTDFFTAGKQLYEQKKYDDARIQLLNAVAQEPNNREMRTLLASTFVALGDLANGAKQLQSLLEYYPDDIPTQLQLGNIYLAVGRVNPDYFKEAQKLAEKISAKEPENVAAMILSGNASAGLADYRTSVDLFEKAISLDPGNTSAFVSLGATQAVQKNFAAAEQAFLKARQVDPKNKDALISLANYYRSLNNPSKAEAIFKEVTALYPDDKNIYLSAATFYAGAGRFQDAEALLKNAQSRTKTDPFPSFLLADVLALQQRSSDVRQLLMKLKEDHPGNLEVSVRLAANLLQDQPDQARKEIQDIIDAQPENPIGHILKGQQQFFAGQYDEAQTTLGQPPAVDSRFPQAQFFLGNIALRKGQLDQAVFHYQKALSVQNSFVPARVALGEVFMNQGKLGDARDELRKALEINPAYVPARALKAALDRGNKNFEAAERELIDLEKQMPDSAYVQRQMAGYNESRGRIAEAEKNLKRARALQPESTDHFRELVLLYLRSKQWDKAMQTINEVPDLQKKAFHYELAGLTHSQAGRKEDAEKAFKKALELDPTLVSANLYLFAGYMNSGKVTEGMKALDDVITQQPKNAGAYATKGLLYERQGNIAEAKKNYNEALKLEPGNAVAANNLAWLLAEEGSDLTTALSLAQTARNREPESPNIADTLGWIHYKSGNHTLAREQLRFAVSKSPEDPVMNYHLGVIYQANKQYSEARAALLKATGSKQEFKERSLAQAALKELAGAK